MSHSGRRVDFRTNVRPALAWRRVPGVATETCPIAPDSYELVHRGVSYRVAFHTDPRSNSWRAWKNGAPICKRGRAQRLARRASRTSLDRGGHRRRVEVHRVVGRKEVMVNIYKVTEARSFFVLAETDAAASASVVAGDISTPQAVDHTTKVALRVPADLHALPLKTAGVQATEQVEALGKLLGREPTIADWLDIERRRTKDEAPKGDAPKDGGT